MNYCYSKGHLRQVSDKEKDSQEGLKIQVISSEEYGRQFQGKLHYRLLTGSMGHTQHCRADMMKDCITGSLYCPNKKNLLQNDEAFGFYLDTDQMIFIDDHGVVPPILKALAKDQAPEEPDVFYFFFEFLEFLIKDDIFFLQEYEKKLAEMEDSVYEKRMEDVTQHMMLCRRELLNLSAYYHQLMNVGEILSENVNEMLTEQETRLFTIFAGRVSGLYESAQILREFAMQLRELYQAQIDIRQNKIMQFLTVVTTVFMPLTLITGWYGMNFVNMPELGWDKSYFVVIAVSILIILLEFWYFRWKKWF